MAITIDNSYYLPVGVDYDPILVMAAIANAVLSIVASEIPNGTIVNDHIATGTIVANEKITALSIEAGQIASDSVVARIVQANAITADKIHADAITTVKIDAGAVTTVKLAALAVTSDKIYAGAVDATKIEVDSLSAISANIGEVTSGTITGGIFRTSDNPAFNRVLIDSAGLRGYDDTLGLVFKIPTDGNAPTFASGIIQYATIVESSIVSNDFKTSSELPWVELGDAGLAYRENGNTGELYNDLVYNEGLYGEGVTFYLGNSGKPVISCETERVYSDVRMYNRTGHSSGASVIGDLEVESSNLYLCTGAGTPGTFSALYRAGGTDISFADGGTGISSWTQYLIPYAATTTSIGQIAIGDDGQVLTSGGAGVAPSFKTMDAAVKALSNLASVAINESLISDTDNTYDLGSDAKQWKDIYINGTAYLDTLSGIGACNTDLLPTNATYDIGSDAAEWKDIWIDGVGYFDSVVMHGNLDFNDHQAIDFIVENRTDDTGMTVTGQMWFRTDL